MSTGPVEVGYRPLELVSGILWGPSERPAPALPAAIGGPREALDAVILDALRHGPCVVSFSGGRDSSTILSLAANQARLHGLSQPIPVTLRVPGSAAADERRWQELVVRHAGLDDWQIIDLGDELDIVGPLARDVAERCGLVPPFNLHFHAPIAELAKGGTLLTGSGGDELLAPRTRPLLSRAVFQRKRPAGRELGLFLGEAAPAWLRKHRVLPPGLRDELSWITDAAYAQLSASLSRDLARQPLAWDRGVPVWARGRVAEVMRESLGSLAAMYGCRIVNPFVEPTILSACSALYRGAGPPGRATALRDLAGDVLPDVLPRRRSKASFEDALFTERARSFAEAWTGRMPVAGKLIDADRLQAEWQQELPVGNAYALMQAAAFL